MAALAGHSRSARDHAQAVLRIRGAVFAAALLPAAVAVVLLAGRTSGHLGTGWDGLRQVLTVVAVVVLVVTTLLVVRVARAKPPMQPTTTLPERCAPDLYRMVADLADRLDVPPPSAVALTPDCDSWLEDTGAPTPTLVIGSPFLWWLRVSELRALLAPVVAGTGPSTHPDVAAARRLVRVLDAASAQPVTGRLARLLLRPIGPHAAEMERLVAAASSARAQRVDHGLRLMAQEQVGLAYAGWDRLLTRVAVPAWRAGRWPAQLGVGVVSALTELSRRDRLAEGFTSRLGERPACDLLESPGEIDRRVSLLAARLFHGEPAGSGAEWRPVTWAGYPEEVVDRTWRAEAARLFAALDTGRWSGPGGAVAAPEPAEPAVLGCRAGPAGAPRAGGGYGELPRPTLCRVLDRLADEEERWTVAARISGRAAREEEARQAPPAGRGVEPAPMGLPPAPPRTGRELLAEYVLAAVCCAAVDAGSARPGLDWLDGPVLGVDRADRAELRECVTALVDDGDGGPLRGWLSNAGIRADKPVRLV
ncbi:hypothetical protein [Streptomyces alkaliterrae]|uniref:Uncharacterized protein n=1 Tax=Streptomyces alkaliterrae TaxID=2213162 RepID=A0A5P0YRC1_9ACTN|nr:hypothetical protein [Streptomyces alkaliterrae]MBB1254180.1 hypothetical protein [Streptomyces alkaliterrae]MBB1259892.1 hypothetical protein [Streptomyces alkaliterrae]MQS02808.1 hypothetical protein [Streptomyces alkaliterrae]